MSRRTSRSKTQLPPALLPHPLQRRRIVKLGPSGRRRVVPLASFFQRRDMGAGCWSICAASAAADNRSILGGP